MGNSRSGLVNKVVSYGRSQTRQQECQLKFFLRLEQYQLFFQLSQGYRTFALDVGGRLNCYGF